MGNFSSLGGLRQDEEFGHATPRAMELLIFRRVRGSHTALYGNTSVKVHPAQSSPFLLVNMNDPREARLLAMRATTSHEVSWCQASIALPNQKVAPAVSFGLGPALSFFSNSDQRLTDVGPVELWATH